MPEGRGGLSPREERPPRGPVAEGGKSLRRGKPRRVTDPVIGVTTAAGRRTPAGSKALEWGKA
jgi:hypothetical protein